MNGGRLSTATLSSAASLSAHVLPKHYKARDAVCADHYVGLWSGDRYEAPEELAGMPGQDAMGQWQDMEGVP